ncbi:MAG TPA: HEAT repeat domain-containing protein [Planctomycetaceae bacterium]|nr:HEAT repeat domain-containing protein [Planctomycetaceae bacterium]
MLRQYALPFAMVAVASLISSADETVPSFVMFTDPVITLPQPFRDLPPGQLALWRQVLARPEVEYQRLAAEAIGHVHRLGIPGMEAARPELRRVLTDPKADPTAVRSAALTLIALDTRDSAAELFEVSRRGGSDIRAVIEPALAEWDHQPMRTVWRDRLANSATPRRDLLLAAKGLATVRDAEALPALLNIVHSSARTADIRLACARAAGELSETGLAADAARMIQGTAPSLGQRLCAVALLARQSDDDARQLLARLAEDVEPAVAAAALGRLYAIDPALVLPLVEGALRSRAAEVRDWAARALIALPTPERIVTLADLLDDPHPDVRGRVRAELFVLAQQAQLDPAIRESAMRVVERESWRGQEQAGLLLAALDHEPAAPRLVALLESPRPEVMIAAAWGLRRLAVPETIPALLDKAQRQSDVQLAQTAQNVSAVDQQVAHLFEALALMRHEPVVPLLRKYVPKNFVLGELSRSAAIWSLGVLLKGRPDDALAGQLMERVRDLGGPGPIPPELELVRRMSAIGIGHMQARSQLPAVREFLGPTVEADDTEFALRWTLKELSGEELPLPPPIARTEGRWFLTPLSKPAP